MGWPKIHRPPICKNRSVQNPSPLSYFPLRFLCGYIMSYPISGRPMFSCFIQRVETTQASWLPQCFPPGEALCSAAGMPRCWSWCPWNRKGLLWHAVDSHFQDLKVVIFHIIREDGPQIVCVHVWTETLHLHANIHLYNIRIYIYIIIHTYRGTQTITKSTHTPRKENTDFVHIAPAGWSRNSVQVIELLE